MNISSVGVAGDWHGNQAWAEKALNVFAASKVSHILHAGDFGYWPTEKGTLFIQKMQEVLHTNNQTLYVTLGNHEDYVQVSMFIPHPDMPGYVYNPDMPNILVAERGARWVWDNVSFVSLGGAASIDFEGRTEGVNWWKEERITLGDVYRTIESGHADVMIAHDSATGVNLFGSHREDKNMWTMEALSYANQSRDMVRQAVDGVKPNIFFHGHYHHYLDTQVNFNDGVEDYSYRNVSLGKDDQSHNMAVLNLDSMEVTILAMPSV